MRALVWHGPRSMRLESVAEAVPGPGEVLLRVEAVGICGSELSGYLGENSLRRPPLVMGHEFVGRVAALGPGAGLAHGARVVVNPLLPCGACGPCRSGAVHLCRERRIVGAARPGGFAELVAVPEAACHPVPDDLSAPVAALAEPLACAVRAAGRAAVEPGGTLAILGAGAIGLLTLAVARRAGPARILVADVQAARRGTAAAWGAAGVLDGAGDVAAAIRAVTGGEGADVVVDAAGVTATRRASVRAVRPAGRAVWIGLHEADSPLPCNEIVRAEVSVTGSFCYSPDDFAAACALLRDGLLRPGPWIEERPLAEGPAAFDDLLRGAVAASKVVLRP